MARPLWIEYSDSLIMKEIADHLVVHYLTVSKVVKRVGAGQVRITFDIANAVR